MVRFYFLMRLLLLLLFHPSLYLFCLGRLSLSLLWWIVAAAAAALHQLVNQLWSPVFLFCFRETRSVFTRRLLMMVRASPARFHVVSRLFFLIHRFLMCPVLLSSRHLNETRKLNRRPSFWSSSESLPCCLMSRRLVCVASRGQSRRRSFYGQNATASTTTTHTYVRVRHSSSSREPRSWLPRRFIQTTIVIHLPSRPVPAEVVVASPATKQHTHTHTYIQREQLLFYFIFFFFLKFRRHSVRRPFESFFFFFIFLFLKNSRNE